MIIEYTIRPVTRFVVCRFHQSEPTADGYCSAGSETCGEFANEAQAQRVAVALSTTDPDGMATIKALNDLTPDPTLSLNRNAT